MKVYFEVTTCPKSLFEDYTLEQNFGTAGNPQICSNIKISQIHMKLGTLTIISWNKKFSGLVGKVRAGNIWLSMFFGSINKK